MELAKSSHPLRLTVYGPSGSGKSTTLKYIFTDPSYAKWRAQFTTIIAIGHSLPEEHFGWADGLIIGLADDVIDQVQAVIDTQISKWNIGVKTKLLLVFEDLIGSGWRTMGKNHSKFFNALATTWRNYGVSYILVTQQLKGHISPVLRDQTTHVLLCAPILKKDNSEVIGEMTGKDNSMIMTQSKKYISKAGTSLFIPNSAFNKNLEVIQTPIEYVIPS